jgi:hypothetical protein
VSRNDSTLDLWTRLCESSANRTFVLRLGYILESHIYDKILLFVQAAITVFMCWYNTDSVSDGVIDMTAAVWVGISWVETCLKMYCMGFSNYFGSWVNKFDFAVVGSAMGGMVCGHFQQQSELFSKIFGASDLSRWFDIYGASVGGMFINLRTIRVVFRPSVLKKLRVVLTIYPFMLNSMALTLMFVYVQQRARARKEGARERSSEAKCAAAFPFACGALERSLMRRRERFNEATEGLQGVACGGSGQKSGGDPPLVELFACGPQSSVGVAGAILSARTLERRLMLPLRYPGIAGRASGSLMLPLPGHCGALANESLRGLSLSCAPFRSLTPPPGTSGRSAACTCSLSWT